MRSLGVLGALPISLALTLPAPATAAATPAQTCQVSQLRAASRLLDAEFGCWAAYHKNPDADPGAAVLLPACRSGAEAAFAAAYQSALDAAGPGSCSLETSVADVASDLELEVDSLVLAISGDSVGADKDERTLHAALSSAMGAALAGALGVESKDAKKDDEPKRLSGRSKARARLLSPFAKALFKANGVPYTGLGAGLVANEVDRIADEFAALSAPVSFAIAGTVQAADGSARSFLQSLIFWITG